MTQNRGVVNIHLQNDVINIEWTREPSLPLPRRKDAHTLLPNFTANNYLSHHHPTSYYSPDNLSRFIYLNLDLFVPDPWWLLSFRVLSIFNMIYINEKRLRRTFPAKHYTQSRSWPLLSWRCHCPALSLGKSSNFTPQPILSPSSSAQKRLPQSPQTSRLPRKTLACPEKQTHQPASASDSQFFLHYSEESSDRPLGYSLWARIEGGEGGGSRRRGRALLVDAIWPDRDAVPRLLILLQDVSAGKVAFGTIPPQD